MNVQITALEAWDPQATRSQRYTNEINKLIDYKSKYVNAVELSLINV